MYSWSRVAPGQVGPSLLPCRVYRVSRVRDVTVFGSEKIDHSLFFFYAYATS